jgi:magnesium chelatase subunit D
MVGATSEEMTDAHPGAVAWSDALMALTLFAVDPTGLAGVAIRSGPGPARDHWLARLRDLLAPNAPLRRIPSHIGDDRLLGGLDLAASLAAGRPVAQRGLLAECDGGVAILTMAERVETGCAAHLTAVLDQGEAVIERDGMAMRLPARLGLIALDEGLSADEQAPEALLDRLAFRIGLQDVRIADLDQAATDPGAVAEARLILARAAPVDDAIIQGLCEAAEILGIDSPRAPILALRAARAHAALRGRVQVTTEDAALAARLVLAPRATRAPPDSHMAPESEAPADTPPPEDAAPPPDPPNPADDQDTTADAPPSEAEMMIEAIQAALPEDLLAQVAMRDAAKARAAGRGGGGKAKSARRGRPIGSRSGDLRPGDRLNLVETLRAAAPWQRLRGGGLGATRVQVRQQDFRIRRFVQDPESTTIFAVDASGSSALNRLSEAKGAVELLLAKAYVSRSRVALIAFRGAGAELLLPATRSLTRAKRQLADLPGGGGTPLAAGIDAARALAEGEKSKQRTPLIVLLTDGRANIGRDGAPGRAAAAADAMTAAAALRAGGFGAVFVDTSPRPQPDGDKLARAMGAVYAPLPFVQAEAVADLISEVAPKTWAR